MIEYGDFWMMTLSFNRLYKIEPFSKQCFWTDTTTDESTAFVYVSTSRTEKTTRWIFDSNQVSGD